MRITHPTRQRALRGPRPIHIDMRVANGHAHQADLAARLTRRDRWLLCMLHEHRVLTSTQVKDLAFPSTRAATQRLLELHRWRVLDRFRPFITHGSAPMHYVLDTAGATIVAAEHGLDPKDIGYRHDRAIGIAPSLRLAHTVGVNGWFATLAATARTAGDCRLTTWWSETRCGRYFGDHVRPDGYGRWTQHDRVIEFFLEFDLGTEPTVTVAAKLHDYAALAATTGIATPVLIWVRTAPREASVRRALEHTWRHLDNPHVVPVATAAASSLIPPASSAWPLPSPAVQVWLPLTSTDRRYGLAELTTAWPHLDNPPPAATPVDVRSPTQHRPHLPPPNPMPPDVTRK